MAMRIYKHCVLPFLMLLSLAGLNAQTVGFSKTNVTCNGGSDGTITITITGGSSDYRYVVYNSFDPSESDSFGPTTNLSHTFINLPPGVYFAFVRDMVSGDVLDYLNMSITQPAKLSATVTSTNLTCFGAGSGTISITSPSGGSGAYDYSINGGSTWQTSGNYTGLAAGTYIVRIRDRNAPTCVVTLNAGLVITQPAELNATHHFTNVTCYNRNNGTISITSPSGGSGSYQYTITGTNPWASGGSYINLAPGTYNVVMRDANATSCTKVLNSSLAITQPAQLTVNDITIIKGLTCNEGSDGQLQAVVSGGTAPYTFDWYKNPSGSWITINQYTQTATNLPQGWYEVRVNDANNCGNPTPATAREFFLEGATDSIPPLFFFDSASVVSTCAGQNNGSISIYAHGGKIPYSYSITAGGASGYQASNTFSNLGAGARQTWAMDKKGCKKQGPDQTVTTTPNSPVSVSITANPSGAICPGTSVLFTATPTNGGIVPSYQWQLNGAAVGTNSPTYTNSTLANGNQVRVLLTSDLRCTTGNPATSNTITAVLFTTTSISVQPVSQAICVGNNVTFSVTAGGSGLSYQWRKNGTNIPGANATSYTINNITITDAGNFDVVVTGTCGIVTSTAATLTVNTPPAITTQPASAAICAGNSAVFSVVATGTGLTYQWRKDGTNISGATGSSYTIPVVAAGDAGNYSVRITGTCGVITSANAALTVNTAPAITGQPVSLTRCTTQSATFTVTATGTGLTYQWRKNGTNIGGATAASYTISSVAVTDAGNYDVVVTGTCGNVTSNAATLTVNTPPVITTQPASAAVCAGNSAVFTVVATGTGLTYQWRKNGTNISGATGASYTIPVVVAGDAGNYSVRITGTCANVTSDVAVLTVNTAPAITGQPVSLTRCTTQSATFTVTATGTGLTYQWRKNGTNIGGATAASYTISSVAVSDAGNYDVVVTGTCGNLTSNIAILTVNTPPAITTQPASVAVCAGGSATFTVAATGAGLTYQWRRNGTNIGGATGLSYTIPVVAPGNAGDYSVVITGTCGNITSANATLTVNTAPAITGQPVSLTRCTTQSATFTVTATGTGLTYQWRKNGTNIGGATAASYTISSVAVTDAGNYDVVVTGTCGNVTSNIATLTVNTPPAITTQPASIAVCAGGSASFTVAATGAGLTYQWRRNGTNIGGATGSGYTIPVVAPGDAGDYSVVITGTCGNITSANATLTVNTAPAITGQPVSLTRCTTQSATFTVTATGTGLTYQWRKNGTNIGGATAASYTISSVAVTDAGNYDVVITGTCGNLTSNIAILTVNTPPAITTQPASVAVCAGGSASFTVAATGAGLTYQWRRNGTNIGGATGSGYTIPVVAPGDAGDYSVVITGTCGNITSANATLTVNTAPAITGQPVSLTRCTGESATFTVTATGTGLTYQWRKDGADIGGATNASYTISSVAATDAANYTVRITGTCGNVTSNAATLTVNSLPVITDQPDNVTKCVGESATFTVTATGPVTSYQWRKGGVNISGATGISYTIPSVTVTDAGNYDVVITGPCGNVTSTVASLTVNLPPSITAQPVSATSCEGTSVTFSVTATGAGLTYQWRKNGANIGGATTAVLTLTNITLSSAANYDVVITGSCGSATSNEATLTVPAKPAINTHPADQEVCEGSTVVLNVSATGTGLSYQWRRNGTNLSGSTGTSLTLNAATPAQSGNYDVLVYNQCDTLASNIAVILIDPATAVISSGNDTLVCEGSTVDFKITANGHGTITYQWQYQYAGVWVDLTDGGDISGTGTSQLIIQNVEVADTGLYRCFISSACGSAYSDPVLLDVNHLVASIGTPAPFLIDSTTTLINVSVRVSDRFLNWDLGFALVAPDGTEVMLKGPLTFPCVFNPVGNGVNATFTNDPGVDAGDTINYCWNTKLITGTFAATGNWNVLHGMDPANGAWQVRVYDSDKSVPDPDGYLRYAALTFTDLDINGDTAVITYNSGVIQKDILNPIYGEFRSTSFVVPIRLMTSCFNSEDARAVVTVQGGIAPFAYQWTGPTPVPAESNVLLGPGSYSVLVTDAIGCSSVATVEVTSPPDIVFDNENHTDTIACFGSAEGVIRSKASGGTGIITYTLLPGDIPSALADSGVFTNLTAGIYTIRATDNNGCALDSVIQIFEHAELTVEIDLVPVIGNATGSITLTASGGVSPYQYSIDNGTTLQDSGQFNDLAAGLYPVYVVDDNGCTFADTVNLSVELLNVNVTKHNVSCYGLADGSFFLAMLDGNGPFTLTGSFTDTLESPTGPFSFTGQTSGLYDIKIEDSEGRIFIDTVEISEPTQIIVDETITDASCRATTEDGSIVLSVTGGSGVFTFEWSNGETTRDISGVVSGEYSVVVSDANGCNSDTLDFEVGSIHAAYANAGDDAFICPGLTHQLDGSAGGDSVFWRTVLPSPDPELIDNPEIINPTVKPETTMDFLYTVYQFGCAAIDTVRVEVDGPYILSIIDANGGDTEGDTVIYLVEGQTARLAAYTEGGFASLAWSPEEYLTYVDTVTHALVDITPTSSDYYTVTATTVNNCKQSQTIHVVVAGKLLIYSGFSPNGDGKNDTWTIGSASEYGDKIRVRVYNRWGELVFESKGYGNSDEWDGTRNDRLMPVGSYYYIIDVKDGKSKPYTGTVTILR